MKSTMIHQFSQVPQAKIQRSVFDRSHGYKTTFDAGYLVPFYVDEALPGDTFNMSVNAFARLSTMLKPIMDNLRMDTFFFAVPIRLLWNHWVNFMGERATPTDTTSYNVPQFNSFAVTTGSLSDYMGLPIASGVVVNSLWHRAYNLIWNEWFRDQNLQTKVVVDIDDGPDDITDYVILKRGKRHDYFTSCLPWPQKGSDVTIPLGSSAPVYGIGVATDQFLQVNPSVRESTGNVVTYSNAKLIDPSLADRQVYITQGATGFPGIRADLTNATAATINALRSAFQLQKMYERDARGGTRYTEIVKSHFGVTSPDARLQRPEYLGGSTANIHVHPVAQTGPNTDATYASQLSAYGTCSINGQGFSKSFTEHCVLIGLVCVTADLSYFQGVNRMFSRRTRFDYYWPSLAHLGEQAVLNKEIYYATADGLNDNAFGYQERFAEYRYKPSQITGKFRPLISGTLEVWNLAQKFTTRPTLGDTFIQEAPPIAKIQAVSNEPHMFFDSYLQLKCARPMPVYSVPGLIDHF